MADPWWFRGARFTKQVERLDASERRDVLTAVARDTCWYRRVAVAVFACAALGAIAVLVHDGVYATGSGDAWRHEFTPFFGVITLAWVIMSERIDLVTSRRVRAYEARAPEVDAGSSRGSDLALRDARR